MEEYTLAQALAKNKHLNIKVTDIELLNLIKYYTEKVDLKENDVLDIEFRWSADLTLVGYMTNRKILIIVYHGCFETYVFINTFYVFKYKDNFEDIIPSLFNCTTSDSIREFMTNSGFELDRNSHTVGDLFPNTVKSARNF